MRQLAGGSVCMYVAREHNAKARRPTSHVTGNGRYVGQRLHTRQCVNEPRAPAECFCEVRYGNRTVRAAATHP
eukprot:176203-Prymnesium_polylepis.1